MNKEFAYIFNSLLRWGIFFGVLYLIFTNFGVFLIIVFTLIFIIYYLMYQFKKKFQKMGGFKFTFNGQDFSNMGSSRAGGFDFEQFQEQFKNKNFNNTYHLNEVGKAKRFFGFTNDPSKDEIKRKYKELAKKYHPDINHKGNELMQQLNHYKEVLLQIFPN